MAHNVKCSICGLQFDRDKVQAVKTGARRYAHASCDPNNKDFVPLVTSIEQNEDYIDLLNYVNNKFGKQANYALIKKQIKQYTTENKYSLSGIKKSLVYWFDVKGNSIDKSNGGIGIVPFTYQAAYDYYYSLFVAQSQNETKDVKTIINKVKEITIPLPKIIIPKRFFNMDEDEEEVSDNE